MKNKQFKKHSYKINKRIKIQKPIVVKRNIKKQWKKVWRENLKVYY
jgi:hypothetical protein